MQCTVDNLGRKQAKNLVQSGAIEAILNPSFRGEGNQKDVQTHKSKPWQKPKNDEKRQTTVHKSQHTFS